MQGIHYHSKGVFIDRRYNDEIYGRHACEHGSLVFRFLKEGAPRRRKRGGFCLDTSGVPAGRCGYRRPASFRRAAPACRGLAPHVFRAPRSCRPKQWRCRRDQSAPCQDLGSQSAAGRASWVAAPAAAPRPTSPVCPFGVFSLS